jgi:hypothetical protein
MRALFASSVVLASLALVPVANAATLSLTGTVKSFNSTEKVLQLSSGKSFTLATGFQDPGIKSGEKVKVSYIKSGKNLEAEMVKILK